MNWKRTAIGLWIVMISLFAVLHFVHLRADFPNYSRWMDWSKYTDEGWYGNAAIQAHLNGSWYVPGDFNPGAALPVLPFLEWVLFFFSGVDIAAARALSVSFFAVNLLLSYLLLRTQHSRWVGLAAATLLATSSYIYCFSRLAILEPLLMVCMLAALNLSIRLPRFRNQALAAIAIGLLTCGMVLTKTTAIFLLPALAWAYWYPLRSDRKAFLRNAVISATTAILVWGSYMLLAVRPHYFEDYKYLFAMNQYEEPKGLLGHLWAYWYSFHGGLWCDRILIPFAGILVLVSLGVARKLWRNPVFVSGLLAAAGYLLFIGYHNNMQPRYYVVVAYFTLIVLAQVLDALLRYHRTLGGAALAVALGAVLFNAQETVHYVRTPEYTFVNAAENLTRYIDSHPNGRRMLLSISGNEIQLATHIPSICDDFGTLDLPSRMERYQPGWYAAWNSLDAGTLEDLHMNYSLEQVATFPAFDDSDRNVLVLFKLHPLSPDARVKRDPSVRNLKVALPGDRFNVPIDED